MVGLRTDRVASSSALACLVRDRRSAEPIVLYAEAARRRARANSVSASGIDLRQPRSGLNYALLRSPYPAAQRDIDADTAVIIQHLVRTLKGALGPLKPLSGSRQFHI
ncbi:hypothetical protein [Mesorhizobium sp.]|uniref:hypothetical protein n=1 Tax=Mesorhizobium sp. TaxID=1871066 RepID=UPI002579D6B9|nr:hypothetical protein [Mesorhizobium sp.]